MLDISKRIDKIKLLMANDTIDSLTYAALECRLTIEYIFLERYQMTFDYLSPIDLKGWTPRHIMQQVLEDANDMSDQAIKVSVSEPLNQNSLPQTKEDYESIEYYELGNQVGIKLKKLDTYWQALSRVALHIPVPTNTAERLDIYGEFDTIYRKVSEVISYLETLQSGNLLIGGSPNDICKFTCTCGKLIQKPIFKTSSVLIASCLDVRACKESYLIEITNDSKDKFQITRRIFKFTCKKCGKDLDIPTNTFKGLRFGEQLNVTCLSCESVLSLVMHPHTKS